MGGKKVTTLIYFITFATTEKPFKTRLHLEDSPMKINNFLFTYINKIQRDIDLLSDVSLVVEAKAKQACMEWLTLKDGTVAFLLLQGYVNQFKMI